ncbi:MAG: hypothetical protein ABSG84_16835 [Acidobacteriaceae bacterium]
MAHPIARTLTTILALTLLSQTLALAQDQRMPAADPLQRWNRASWQAPSGSEILVITMARPTHRIACRVQSFTVDQLVCKRPSGKTRLYQPQDIAALITPAQRDLWPGLLLGFTGAGAAATWGTVVLAATCIPCAVATGVAAGFLYLAGGVALIGALAGPSEQPEALLYLAPGQTLHVNLRY